MAQDRTDLCQSRSRRAVAQMVNELGRDIDRVEFPLWPDRLGKEFEKRAGACTDISHRHPRFELQGLGNRAALGENLPTFPFKIRRPTLHIQRWIEKGVINARSNTGVATRCLGKFEKVLIGQKIDCAQRLKPRLAKLFGHCFWREFPFNWWTNRKFTFIEIDDDYPSARFQGCGEQAC